MRRLHPVFAASLILAACSSGGKVNEPDDSPVADEADTDTDTDADSDADTDADTDTDTDTDTDVLCDATVSTLDPEPGFPATPLDQVVTVTYDKAIAPTDPWRLEVIGISGTSALASDGLSASFTPDIDLVPDTFYTVEADVCDDFQSASFRTLPGPIETSLVDGRTYLVQFSDLQILQPQNGGLLNTFLPVDLLVVQVTDVDEVAETFHAYGTTGDLVSSVAEISCGNATDVGVVDFSLNPFFSMGPTTLFFEGPGDEPDIPVRDFELLGSFSPDGNFIVDVEVYALVDMTEEPGGIGCSTAALLANGTCVACDANATGNYCLVLEATAPEGRYNPAVDIYGECFDVATTP